MPNVKYLPRKEHSDCTGSVVNCQMLIVKCNLTVLFTILDNYTSIIPRSGWASKNHRN